MTQQQDKSRYAPGPATKRRYLTGVLSIFMALVLGVALYAPAQHSDAASISDLQSKSRQLQAEIAENQKKAAEFHAHAETLQAKISELSAEISVVNKQIQLLSLQIEELELKIEETNKEIGRQRSILGANIRVMYFEGDVSTIEMLASSENLSEFVDKEQYRSAVQSKIKSALDKIKVLKAELKIKQDEVQKLLGQQQAQRRLLDEKRLEQQRLLDATRGEEARFQAMVAEQRKQLAEAEAALARAIGAGSYRSAPVGPVAAGDPVGGIGSSGLSSGPHLHLEVRKNGADTNPGPYIERRPVPMPPAWVSQGYGNPDSIYMRGYHPGIDYAGPAGTQISAIKPGYMYRGCSNDLLGTSNNAYGYVAVVEHSDGTISVYAHMTGGPSRCNYNTYY